MGWDILCWGTGNRVGLSQAQSSAPSPVSAGASAAPLRGRAGRLQPWGTAQSGCHGLRGPWWQLGRAGKALPRDTEGKYQGLRPSAVAAGNLSPHHSTYCPFCQTLLGTQQWGSGTVMSSQASASVPKEGYKPSTVMLRRCTGGKCASRTWKSFSHHEQKIKEKKSFVGGFTTPKIFLLLLRRQSCSTAAFFL